MNDIELIRKYVSKEMQEEAIKKLESGFPVQYIIGNVEFFGNIINVNEDVLIPRFETEYLVDKTINYIKMLGLQNPKILEIGTGSGCISIALKKSIVSDITALDISKRALEIAKENAVLNKTNIKFVLEDINNFKSNDKFDVIISNPPYVPYESKYDEKIKYEPENAIFAGEKGIYFYRGIIERLKNNLKDNYLISFEIGDNESELIKQIVDIHLPKAYFKLEKDYNNYERYVFISNKKL